MSLVHCIFVKQKNDSAFQKIYGKLAGFIDIVDQLF